MGPRRLGGVVDLVKVHDRVDRGEMPPEGMELADDERRAFLDELSQSLTASQRDREASEGRTVLRRLTRTEYVYSLRDLLGVHVDVRELLPADTPSYGFDKVAAGLRFSQLQMEKYLEASDAALQAAITFAEEPDRVHQRFSLKDEREIRENLDTPEGNIVDPVAGEKHRVIMHERPDAVVLYASQPNLRQFSAPRSGRYRMRASAYAWHSRGEPVALQIYTHRWRGTRLVGFFQMPENEPREVEVVAHLNRNELLQIGPHRADFDEQGHSVWNVGAAEYDGRGLAVQWIEVEGPLGPWPPQSTTSLFEGVPLERLPAHQRPWKDDTRIAYDPKPDDPHAAARLVIERFAGRAFRRPLRDGEAEPYVQLALSALDQGRSFEEAVRLGLQGVLLAPQFILLEERPGQLDAYAVASRLSYFLWSSMPDEQLLTHAESGDLLNTRTLRAETERLLDDPRSMRFVEDFCGQWLDLDSIDATSPDMQLYPEFDEVLKRSMVAESEAFFAELLEHDLSVANIIDSDFLMLDHTMALHYGIDGVQSERFTRVELPDDSPRGGMLTQAAVLKVTANGTVTSPVTRGTWVMKNILGQPPQPPPPNVGSVEPDTRGATTIRELLAQHRNSLAARRAINRSTRRGLRWRVLT